jgi:hypothetical protein
MKKLILEKGYERHGAPVFVIRGECGNFFRDVGEDIYRARKELARLSFDLPRPPASIVDRTLTPGQAEHLRHARKRLSDLRLTLGGSLDPEERRIYVGIFQYWLGVEQGVLSTYTEEDEDDDS